MKLHTKVDKILENQEKILRCLENLSSRNNVQQDDTFEKLGIKLPLSTVNEMDSFEKHLSDESSFRNMVSKFFYF